MQCKRCFYTINHPLNLTIDDSGICSGCRIHEEKDEIDWAERWNKLEELVAPYRSVSGSNYDCIVPVSGARDSYYIVHLVKNILKLNPLLVSYNKHYNTQTGARNLANLRIKFDCDLIMQTVNPRIVKQITRETMCRFGSVYWHCISGETVFPVQQAVKLKIPLIIWGAHQGIDQVGMFSHLDEVEMTRKYRKEHDLMGYEAEDLYGEFENLGEEQLIQFQYPDDYLIQRIGVRGIYLNNYARWDSRTQHEQMIKLYQYETSKMSRTFDFYNDVDSYVYTDIHDYIKSLKHGYTKVVDHVCREIRLKRMTKPVGSKLIERYSHQPALYIDLFASWLGVEEDTLTFLLDEMRNPELWVRDDLWNWQAKNTAKTRLDIDREFQENCVEEFKDFKLTEEYRSTDAAAGYVLIPHGNRLS